MAFTHSKNAVLKIDDAGATLRDLSSFLDQASLERVNDLVESTTFGKSSKTYEAGLNDGTIPYSGFWDPTATTGPDAILTGLLGLATASDFEFYPAGEPVGATKPKYTGTLRVKDYKIDGQVGDLVKFSGTFQITGDVTRATS